MFEIRYANASDVPLIVSLAMEEHALSKWRDLPFNREVAERTARRFIDVLGHTMLVSKHGYLAGLVQDMGFTGVKIAIEYSWFAKDGSGLELLQRFEAWGRNMGASGTVVHDYVGDGRLGKVLSDRRGYAWLGSALMRMEKQ